ncbi:MAG: KH domain-containing protein [Candidatus Riflebacteria bacterium]|nr:KH domain-containing protein [Candidatus Riflebacteria bacterium]
MEEQGAVRELISYILGHLVTRPDQVKIDLDETRRRPVFQVQVAPEDVGVVIGRSGRTINAIRTLLRAVPEAPDRVWLELLDERGVHDGGPEESGDREAEEFDDEGPDGASADGEARPDDLADSDAPDEADDRDGPPDDEAPREPAHAPESGSATPGEPGPTAAPRGEERCSDGPPDGSDAP